MASAPLALTAVVLLCAACASDPGVRGASAAGSPADNGALDWAASMLGGAPQVWEADRPPANAPEPDRYEVDRDMLPDATPIGFAAWHAHQVDLYRCCGHVTADEAALGATVRLAVFHGVPAWLDPARAFPRADTPSDFSFAGTTPAGVLTYRVRPGHTESTYSDFVLSVLPGRTTWILADGPAAQRIVATVGADPREPPLLAAAPGSESDMTGVLSEFVTRNDGWLLHAEQLVAVGVVTYPAPAGAPRTVAAKKVFREPWEARDAAAHIQMLLAKHQFPGEGAPTGVQAIGSTLLLFAQVR